MISYLDCPAARELLEAFVDGELPVADQVAVESHLRWCDVCATRVEDLKLIGASLRVVSCAMRAPDRDRQSASLSSDLLTRIRAERDQSLGSQLRGQFGDMRLFWPAIGASLALVACLGVSATVVSGTMPERPDSLAGMIQMLANPGSDENPLRLDGGTTVPPRALSGAALDEVPGDEAVFALSAVVTREGRVENYEVLMSERASVRRHDTAVETGDVSSVVNAVKQSRFAPAQGVDGEPVAVNVVWVLARTTVKASKPAVLRSRPAPVAAVAPEPAPVVDAPDAPAPEPPSVPSTTV